VPERNALQELSDHQEITQLLYRYGYAIDARDVGALADIFTPDAIVDYAVPGGAALAFPELQAWLTDALASFRATQHAMASPLVTLAGDTAEASTNVIATHVQVSHDGHEVAPVLHGVYRDRLARTPAGWRITHRRLKAIWIAGRFLAPDNARRFPPPERRVPA
jgi:ketosteroid isomerase-like protein